MDAEIKKEWVAALRSGKYQQGRGSLKQLDGDGFVQFCCLGVLCDVLGLEGDGGEVGLAYRFKDGDVFTQGYLPQAVVDQVGLPDGIQQKLAKLNDGLTELGAQDFNSIADYIEANL